MRENKTNKRYGRLLVIKFAYRNWEGRAYWFCKCDCGKETIIRGDALGNSTNSCGCLQKETRKKYVGKNSSRYINGKDCGKYTKEIFELKESIRKRDNYTCQKCGMTQKQSLIEFNRKLDVHHIDGNDRNNIKGDMITLCKICHNKELGNR